MTADKANIIEELDMQLMALQQKSTTSLIHSERMCMSEIGTQASRVSRKASSRVGSSDGRELQEVRAISSRAHADELESLSPRPAIGYPTPRLHSANLDQIPISDTYLAKSNSVQSHSVSSYSPMPARRKPHDSMSGSYRPNAPHNSINVRDSPTKHTLDDLGPCLHLSDRHSDRSDNSYKSDNSKRHDSFHLAGHSSQRPMSRCSQTSADKSTKSKFPHEPEPACSIRSKSSQSQSLYSAHSASSRNSSYFRAKATEAAAKAAAAEVKLRANLEAQQVEDEIKVLEKRQQLAQRHITELKLRGEVEAAQARQAAYESALIDENADHARNTLFRPPSKAVSERSVAPLQTSALGPIKSVQIKSQPTSDFPPHDQTHDIQSTHIAQEISQSVAKTIGESMASAAIAMNQSHLAKPAIFSGDPLNYKDWQIAFDGLIGACPYTPLQKLHLLQDYVIGEALECVKGYCNLQDPNDYQVAIDALANESRRDKLIEERQILAQNIFFM